MEKSDIVSVKLDQRDVIILLSDGHTLQYPDCWLRDHCRCSKCYRSDTFQRAKHILDIPDTKIENLDVSNPDQLHVTWDDGHQSIFNVDFLLKYDYKKWYEGSKLRPIVWHGAKIGVKVANVHVDEFIKTMDGAKLVFQSLLDYGIAFINGVESTLPATEVVCQALGGIQHTLFGGLWTLTTEAQHADTAYTNVPLATHNDNTYFTEAAGSDYYSSSDSDGEAPAVPQKRLAPVVPAILVAPAVKPSKQRRSKTEKPAPLADVLATPSASKKKRSDPAPEPSGASTSSSSTSSNRLQIFHCIRHSEGSGGETVLVDGFYGAKCLKENHPVHFETLTTCYTEAEFLEDGHHHKFSAPIIRVDRRTGELEQIRFNVYDRSPMPFPNSAECRTYYEALRNLSRYYEDINNQYQFKLKPGTVVAIDNFRVLHGRRGFSGNRMLCGSYVARSDWLDRARALKLIQ